MPLAIPPAVNYPNPLSYVPARWNQVPVEGAKFVPIEIDWGSMGGTSKCVNFNLQNNANLAFSQIVAVKFDNSACGSDVQIIFPDTGDTVTFPAYQQSITPVFTNGQQFFVLAPNAQPEDVTLFSVHNAMPPPVDLSRSSVQEFAAQVAIPVATGTTTLVPSTVSGTLEQVQINGYVSFGGVVLTTLLVKVQDGNGTLLGGFEVAGNTNSTVLSGTLYTSPPISVRFTNGLFLVQTEGGGLSVSGNLFSSVYYRAP